LQRADAIGIAVEDVIELHGVTRRELEGDARYRVRLDSPQ
jgi:hypothetical protein